MRPMVQFAKEKYGHAALIVAEVGVQRGYNAKQILKNFNITNLALVDIWDSNITNPRRKGKQVPVDNPGDEIHFPKMMELVGNEPNTTVHRMLSKEACMLYPDEHFDFIYIDASHAYQNVKDDCAWWYPKVKTGGVIGGHDYFYFVGCKQAVDEFITENRLQLQTKEPDWWIVK